MIENNNEQTQGFERKKNRVQYNLNYPLPEVRSSLERDIKVLKSFVTLSNSGQKFIGAKDIASLLGINPQIIGGILSFFSKIEFADKEGYTYKPIQEVVNIVNTMKFESDDSKAGKALSPLILRTWFGEMSTHIFNSENGSLPKEELFKRLGQMCGAEPEYHKGVLNRIIEYLSYSHLIELDSKKNLYYLKNTFNDSKKVSIDVKKIPLEENSSKNSTEQLQVNPFDEVKYQKFDLALANNRKATVIVPTDIDKKDVVRLNKLLDLTIVE